MANKKPVVANATGEFEQVQAADDLTLSGRSLVGVNSAQFNSEADLGSLGAAVTIDWVTNGGFQKGLLSAACTITINSFPGVGRYQLRLVQNGAGAYTVTWAGTAYSASRWVGTASAPSVNVASAGETIVTFYYDGTTVTQMMAYVGTATPAGTVTTQPSISRTYMLMGA